MRIPNEIATGEGSSEKKLGQRYLQHLIWDHDPGVLTVVQCGDDVTLHDVASGCHAY